MCSMYKRINYKMDFYLVDDFPPLPVNKDKDSIDKYINDNIKTRPKYDTKLKNFSDKLHQNMLSSYNMESAPPPHVISLYNAAQRQLGYITDGGRRSKQSKKRATRRRRSSKRQSRKLNKRRK
jgi:hypothetical protein